MPEADEITEVFCSIPPFWVGRRWYCVASCDVINNNNNIYSTAIGLEPGGRGL